MSNLQEVPEILKQQLAIQEAKDNIKENKYGEKNTPYIKTYDKLTGELIDVFPFLSKSLETRGMRRRKERVNFTMRFGKLVPFIEKKTKSAKRKSNWH